jgi:hypothetical protein
MCRAERSEIGLWSSLLHSTLTLLQSPSEVAFLSPGLGAEEAGTHLIWSRLAVGAVSISELETGPSDCSDCGARS